MRYNGLILDIKLVFSDGSEVSSNEIAAVREQIEKKLELIIRNHHLNAGIIILDPTWRDQYE